MNFDLLRFSHLTLPICAGNECQDIKQEPKTTKLGKGQIAMASQRRAKRRALPESSRLLRHKDGHRETFRQAKQWAAERRRLPESWKFRTRVLRHGEQKSCQAK